MPEFLTTRIIKVFTLTALSFLKSISLTRCTTRTKMAKFCTLSQTSRTTLRGANSKTPMLEFHQRVPISTRLPPRTASSLSTHKLMQQVKLTHSLIKTWRHQVCSLMSSRCMRTSNNNGCSKCNSNSTTRCLRILSSPLRTPSIRLCRCSSIVHTIIKENKVI